MTASFHSLRHSFKSAMANADVPLEIRQKLTGHASQDMNKHYTHLELETVSELSRPFRVCLEIPIDGPQMTVDGSSIYRVETQLGPWRLLFKPSSAMPPQDNLRRSNVPTSNAQYAPSGLEAAFLPREVLVSGGDGA
jgi:Phage integrase family